MKLSIQKSNLRPVFIAALLVSQVIAQTDTESSTEAPASPPNISQNPNWLPETPAQQAAERALLPGREKIIMDGDNDGWDDLWVLLEIKSRKLEQTGILQRPNADDDGDGFTNREEMLLFRDPFRRELIPTPEEQVRLETAAKEYSKQTNRQHLLDLLPRIEIGLRTARAAKPPVFSEEEIDPAARKQRLQSVAKVLLIQEENRRKNGVRGISKEARDALSDPSAGVILGSGANALLELIGPDSLISAQTMGTASVWPGGLSTAPDLTGAGRQIGVWEAGGGVFGMHLEFLRPDGSSRILQIDNPAAELVGSSIGQASLSLFNFHATEVAGVMASAGTLNAAKGMAFEADLAAYGSGGDIAEMMAAAATGMELSNHSYSNRYGWIYLASNWFWLGPAAAGEDPRFGLYQRQSREIDIVGYENPNYLSVWSSGNEGAETGPVDASGVIPANVQYYRIHDDDGDGNFTVAGSYTAAHPSDSGTPLLGASAAIYAPHLSNNVPGGIGVDTLKSSGVAKNNLAIGAINDIPAGYAQSADVVIASFSSRGPTDDGRVKPDLVADGTSFTTTDFVTSPSMTIANASFELPVVPNGGSANGSTSWNEDSPGSGSAQTTRINSFSGNSSQVLRINASNYRVWQDLASVNLATSTQYVLTVSLGKLTGTTSDANQVRVSIFTNGFANLLAETVFSPGTMTPLTNNPGTFGDFQVGFFVGAAIPSGSVRAVVENLGTGVAFVDFVRLSVAPNNLYTTAQPVSGTSYSAPSVTGSLALLQQENASFGNGPMLASTWKALLVTTADDGDRLPGYYADTTGGLANLYPGPDYYYGWGLMNTRRAAELLDQNQRSTTRRTHLREHTLFNGNTVEILVDVGPSTTRLQPTLCWTDPAFQTTDAPSGVDESLPAVVVDATASMLINDLDLKVIRPDGGAAVESWKLNPAAPRAPASRGDNTVDNVEQATVLPLSGQYLTAGTYKLVISHKGSLRRAQQSSANPLRYQLLAGGYQKFSLAIAGNIERAADWFGITSIDRAVTPTSVLVPLTWASVKGLRYRVQQSLDLQTWTDQPGDIDAVGISTTTTVTEAPEVTRVFFRVKEVSP